MSLTSQIANQDSPVSRWFREEMHAPAVQAVVGRINRTLSKLPRLIVDNSDPAHVGRAFDYAFRWEVAPLKANELVAWLGTQDRYDQAVLAALVQIGNGQREARARASLVLSWFEQAFRTGRQPDTLLVERPDQRTCLNLMARVTKQDEEDVQLLINSIPGVWTGKMGGNYIPNPTFEGSVLVGGADADWIFGRTLYDCKVSRKREPFTSAMLLQIAGYVLLDFKDHYGIRNVGWYFARHQHIETMGTDQLFRDLPASRKKFEKHLRSFSKRERSYLSDNLDVDGGLDAWF